MILQPLESKVVSNLLDSDKTVAICRAEGERLKRLVLLVRDSGYGVIVVETASGDHYVAATANPIHEGNLVGDVRRWSREYGYQFSVKRADQRISASKKNVLMLPDGWVVEIQRTYTIAPGFTHWALSGRERLTGEYVRL